MNLTYLAEADAATLKLELARAALESAKAQFDLAKQEHEEVLGRAEESGFPKAKLKKLTEERVQALLSGGLIEVEGPRASLESRRPRKAARPPADAAADSGSESMPGSAGPELVAEAAHA